MARMMGKTVWAHCHCGPYVGGLPIPGRKIRRRARAVEKARLRRELARQR